MLSQLTNALVRRHADAGPITEAPDEHLLPLWAGALVLLNLVILLPVIYFISYTLVLVVPTLAMVEDENLPAYEALGQADEDMTIDADHKTFEKHQSNATRAITANLRQTLGQLRARGGGFRALFHGLFCKLFLDLVTSGLAGLIAATVGAALGGRHQRLATAALVLLPGILLVQFRAAWIHIVMTPLSPRHFWSRLPPFGRTLRAAIRPLTVLWAAETLTTALPVICFGHLSSFRAADSHLVVSFTWKQPAIAVAIVLGRLLLVLPAEVVLTRVLASLLPADENTIVPFDRSFHGRLEPAVLTHRPWATMADAWFTFSKSAWRRLVVVYIKVLAASAVLLGLIVLFLLPQAVFIPKLINTPN